MVKFVLVIIILFSFGSTAIGSAELHHWEDLTGLAGGSGDTKILLVHGFLPGVLTDGLLRTIPVENWNQMARAITQNEELAEKTELYVFLYQPYFDDIAGLAENLALEIERFGLEEKELIVIAHSMGGLIVRHYINYLQGADRVGALFTLGTPHKGIPVLFTADNLGLGPAIQDMRGTPCLMERFGFIEKEEDSYLQALNAEERYANRYYTFSGRLDPSVSRNFFSYVGEAYYQLISSLRVPGDGIVSNFSSSLEGAHNFPPVEGVYHQGLFQNKELISSIISGLESLVLGRKFPVSGRIKGENGEAPEGIEVKLGSETVITDQQGFFQSSGNYEFGEIIEPQQKEGISFFPPYQPVDGREEAYQFSLKETFTIGGKIQTFFTDDDPQGSTMLISSVEDHHNFFKMKIGKDGSFRAEDIPAGTYRFFLFHENRPGLSFQKFEVDESALDLEVNFFHLFGNNN